MIQRVLSIQSHVVHGYVGNRAAVFPLQRIGIDVSAMHTVQFSNHPGYGHWQGDIFAKSHILSLWQGLCDLPEHLDYQGLLSGYLGAVETGQVISKIHRELKQMNPELLYCCDPVLGDHGRGLFVPRAVAEYFRDTLVTQADLLTPNVFELAYLTGREIHSLTDIMAACRILLARGPRMIAVTSVSYVPAGQIGILLMDTTQAFLVTTPKLDFQRAPNGAGDATAALLIGHYLQTRDIKRSLLKTKQALYAILRQTAADQQRELSLIQAQAYFDCHEFPDCTFHPLHAARF